VGASDFPACRTLGDCRTYVEHPGTRPPTPAEWLRGAVEGRSFVTTGPLLLLEVDGRRPGDVIDKKASGPFDLAFRVRVRCEVTPVSNLELVVNGLVAKRLDVPAERRQGSWVEVTDTVTTAGPCWVAARAYSNTPGGQPDAEAHTNPVTVQVNGRAPYRQASLDAWLDRVDRQIAVHTRRDFADKPKVLAYFQQARDRLLAIRAAGGLAGDDALLREVPRAVKPEAASRDLASDGSIGDATAAELREFLKPLPPQTPQQAIDTCETVPGFRMELVAAEPLVHDPVAAAFDEDGNLYVAEMRDYPYRPPPGQSPLGSVRLLRDRDGDGRFDESHLFADQLLWPAGVAPWRGGVFVAAPPDIWYFKDTDGDCRADLRQRLFTGFGIGNQQAMLNNLQWWLDHRIYGSTAGNGGSVRRADDPNVPAVSVSGRDFRFDPVTGSFETITGTVQFGNTFDDWGNRFLCSESQPLKHVVQPEQYLARNPYLPVPSAIHNVAPGPVPIHRISPIERWRHIRSSRRLAQRERPPGAAGVSHHVIDAAAGVTVYRGGAYPPEFYGNVFVGDGQNNLVHRRVLERDGVSFRSRRADEKAEFVRSSDIWFRPVNFLNAPDGTLYCLDMSREVLESIHIPLDVVQYLDLTSGRDHGRIYRIAPTRFRSAPPPRLSRASTAELVAALESPHGWWRDTAHRLLYERQDLAAVPALEQVALTSRLAQARLHALWSLDGLQALDDRILARALADPHAGVRENAVRLAEQRMRGAAALLDAVLVLADDPDARVRFQVALTLGETLDARALPVLARLARTHADDPWMRTAILSSAVESAGRLLVTLWQEGDSAATEAVPADLFRARASGVAMLEQLATVVGARNRPSAVDEVLAALAASNGAGTDAAVRERLVLALGSGQKRSGQDLSSTARAPAAARLLVDMLTTARRTAADARLPPPQRERAIRVLGCFGTAEDGSVLVGLLAPREPQAIQLAAVRALSESASPDLADRLLVGWPQYAPDVRHEETQALLAREDRTRAFLRAVERGAASAASLDATRRDLLLKHRNESIRQLAARLFGRDPPSPRGTVIADYKAVLKLTPNPLSGARVFDRVCAACHQLGNRGYAIGPNLASSPARDPESLLVHILDPNQYVLPNYVQYVVADKQGRTFTGMIADQTATSITLKRERDASDTLLRGDIEEMASTGKSLMPEGVERDVSKQEMADLLAYLSSELAKAGPEPVRDHRTRDFGTLPGLVEPNK
jgi:putative membrane-bound dehydrogenase-like protein